MIALVRLIVWGFFLSRRWRGNSLSREDNYLYFWLCVLGNSVAGISLPIMLDGNWVAGGVFATAIVLTYPWLIARTVFVPLGLWRLSFVFGWLSRLAWHSDGSGSVAVATLALFRKQARTGSVNFKDFKALDFLSRRVRKQKLSPTTVLGDAFIARLRGDASSAIELFESLGDLSAHGSGRAHKIASNYLIATAAENGQWRRIGTLTEAWPRLSFGARFFAAVAAVLTGSEDAPSRARLYVLWLLSGSPIRCFPLLRRALVPAAGNAESSVRTRPSQNWGETEQSAGDETDPLRRALGLHLRALATPASEIEIADLVEVGRAWDEASATDSITTHARERGAVLQSRRIELVADEFQRTVEIDLAELIRKSGICLEALPTTSPTLRQAAQTIREELLVAVEMGFDALADRTDALKPLAAIEEWHEYRALRKQHRVLVETGGPEARRVVFPKVHHAGCGFAVWLWNERDEYILANAIFRWLLAEATIVGDAGAIELQNKNVEAGL